MKIYVMDAFAAKLFGGNQAGVALPERDVSDETMRLIAAELNLAGVRTERLQAAYNFDLLLAQLLETAGISDEFPAYARRSDARPVLFDKK